VLARFILFSSSTEAMTSTSGRVTRSTKRAASSTDATASTVPKTETKSDSSTSAATGVTKKRKADVLTELDRDAGQDSIVPATKKKRARLSCKKQEYKHQEIEPIDDLYNGESFYGIILDMEGPCPECLEIADRFTTGLAEDELTAIHYMITREDQSSDAAASKEAKAGAGGTSGAGVFSAGASAATGASSAGAGSSLSSSGSKGFDVPGEEKKLTRGRVCDLVLEVFMRDTARIHNGSFDEKLYRDRWAPGSKERSRLTKLWNHWHHQMLAQDYGGWMPSLWADKQGVVRQKWLSASVLTLRTDLCLFDKEQMAASRMQAPSENDFAGAKCGHCNHSGHDEKRRVCSHAMLACPLCLVKCRRATVSVSIATRNREADKW
jgi:hypothetical protein